MVRLPARMRTWGKRGYGPLEDRVVVLGCLEVDDVLCGIDEVSEERQLFREPPAVGRLVDPLERLGEERLGRAAAVARAAARAVKTAVARLIIIARALSTRA